uniref:Retrotransposon protein, putative, unclassified n=1 Tax=Oryza sativa subsp. japonica TaxID=39947 RepID=Q9FW30_ORYSJ|nr:hypothetical protein [Oryza sativa Japonica Group]
MIDRYPLCHQVFSMVSMKKIINSNIRPDLTEKISSSIVWVRDYLREVEGGSRLFEMGRRRKVKQREETELGAISKLRGRTTRLRILTYADNVVIFINPTQGDVKAFADILDRFVTNLQKSSVAAIRCDSIDLTGVLDGVPAMRANFPLKYLGLPLVRGRLRKMNLQPVFDKISGRVAGGEKTWVSWENHARQICAFDTTNLPPFSHAKIDLHFHMWLLKRYACKNRFSHADLLSGCM